MSYAVGMKVSSGIAFIADTRTNAGMDNIATFPKMHSWSDRRNYCFTVMFAGNLGIHHSVREEFEKSIASDNFLELHKSIFDVAVSLGQIIRDTVKGFSYDKENDVDISTMEISVILGGQLINSEARLFLIYSAGNFIEATDDTPFLSIGEHKYGIPFIHANYSRDLNESTAFDVLINSMEITSRFNVGVGPPIDYKFYKVDAFDFSISRRIKELDSNNSLHSIISKYKNEDSFANPSLDVDEEIIDILRNLKSTTKKLSSYIRGINDPNLATADIRAVRAYIDALQEFIDLDGHNKPDEIPSAIILETEKSLRRVDWWKLSDHANRWAKTIGTLIRSLIQ